jgi:hypothetical protein
MDSKKVIEKLVKIAENQQKIINKLAQSLSTEPPPQSLPEPARPQFKPADAVLNALAPGLRASLVTLEEHGNEIWVKFKPGQATQARLDAITATVQKVLTQKAYTVKSV